MSSFEDRLWSDLAANYGAELAEVTRPAPVRRARGPVRLTSWIASMPKSRRVLVVGGGVLALVGGTAGAVALTQTGGTPGIALGPAIARATIGNDTFVLAPDVGANATPGELCLSGSGPGVGTECGSESAWDAHGTMGVLRGAVGKVRVSGYAPQGTTAVSADGKSIPLSGRFFMAVLPSSPKSVTFTTPAGNKSLTLGPFPTKQQPPTTTPR
jgi:hypothetical protein